MPKVTAEHRDDRRREIASAALRVFARKGFSTSSMADIIAESGLSAGAIYGHYKNKDDLIQVAISDLLDLRISDALERGDAPTTPGDIVTLFVKSIAIEAGEPGILLQVWAQAALDPSMQQVTTRIGEQLRTIYRDYLTGWYATEYGFGENEAAEAADSFASLYVGIVQGYIVQNTIFSDFDGAAYLAAASAIRPDVAHPVKI